MSARGYEGVGMANRIAVVDDDTLNLKVAGHILSKNGMRVTGLNSGRELLDYLDSNKVDLILLDIMMPVMDGFETLEQIRLLEREGQKEETPVIFLTSDSDNGVETRGFEMGVSDFIRKPFDPDVLMRRIENVLNRQGQINRLQKEATIDKMTGFLNKAAVTDKLDMLCRRRSGFLMMIDLDSFKLVNDIYGHEMGDKVLIAFSEIIKKKLGPDDVIGRIGGDEFTAFVTSLYSETDLVRFTADFNTAFLKEAKKLMGDNMEIPLGVSVGAVFIPGKQTDYSQMLKNADKALYSVKQNGKHGCAVYGSEEDVKNDNINMCTLSMILSERNISNSALRLEWDSFVNVYRFVVRYLIRYHKDAGKLLFTLEKNVDTTDAEYERQCELFGDHTCKCLRKSDLLMQYRKNQYFVFLTEIKEEAIEQVIGNIIRNWRKKHGEKLVITYEVEFMSTDDVNHGDGEKLWVAVVDDDAMNLKVASHILSKKGMEVTPLSSGYDLLEFVKENRPDLILLDVNMPEIDGFETIRILHAMERDIADIPVVFLTSDNEGAAEKEGLSLGAIDFIRKPFVPEVLTLRIKQIVELLRLQKHLSDEVARKTKENEQLFLNVVSSLAGAIDAKDTYTNGHSGRVAEYSREIARRYGYNPKEQSDIYIIALLHDVGKIGVPDAVINKPGKLSDEEFEHIKRHPVIGSQILKNIKEMPLLSTGARWHHERYGGGGYPDGLSGDEIPEEARIIAVADAYDAMTSTRSYRSAMDQASVRAEIDKGSGTQFDPRFADIMLMMIDEDKEYEMREQ